MADDSDITIRLLDENGKVEDTLEPEVPEEERDIDYTDEDPNLVLTFKGYGEAGAKALKELGEEVAQQFDRAWDGAEEHRKKLADAWKIFAGDLPPKEFPYKGCANAHVPIAIENICRVTFRVEAEMADDWSAIVKFSPMGPEDKDQALLCEVHTNWQYRVAIPDFKRQMSRGLLHYFFNGDVVCHSWRNFDLSMNRHEILSPDEFVVPFTHVSTMPDFSDVPYRVRIFRYYKHELEAMRGTWDGIDEVIEKGKPAWDDDPETPGADATSDVTGHKKPDDDKGAPFTILWYEGWLELPKRPQDERAVERFCRAVVDKRTRKLMLLTIHEMEEPGDVQRLEKQNAELDAYQQAVGIHAQELQQRQQIISQHQMMMGGMGAPPMDPAMDMPPPPEPPKWMEFENDSVTGVQVPKSPRPARKVPINLFSHGVLIEPIYGTVGLGFGRIQADYNIAANTALSQFTDAATLANIWSLLIPKSLQVEGGKIEMAPGKVNYVKAFAGTLRDQIYEFKPGPANPQLLELTDRMVSYGQSSIQAPDVLSGNPGKSGETFRGISTRVEQASKQLSVAARKFGDVITQITRNNCTLNSMFLPDEEVFTVGAKLLALLDEAPIPAPPPMPMPPMPPGAGVPGGPPPPGGPAAAPPPGAPPVHPPSGPTPGGPAPMGPPHPPMPGIPQGPPPGMPPMGPPMPPPMMAPPPPPPTHFTFKVGRKMYEQRFNVECRSDLKFSSREARIQEADEMLGMAQKIPPLQMNPTFMYLALKKAFQARGWADMIMALGPPPPLIPYPMGMASPPPGAGGPPQVVPGAGGPHPPQGAPPPKPPGPPDGIPGPKPGGQP